MTNESGFQQSSHSFSVSSTEHSQYFH